MNLMNKSRLFVFGLFLISFACTKEVDVSSVLFDKDSTLSSSYSISINDVYDYLSDPVKTKSQDIRIDPVITDNDTTLFIVNYDNGWEVLSSDRRAPRVFAKSDRGSITEAELKTIPALSLLYGQFVSNIHFLKEHLSYTHTDNFYEKWDNTITVARRSVPSSERGLSSSYEIVQNHLLQTKWGQGHPWNIRAPYTSINLQQHCLTGCGPVAMAQLLYYLQYKVGIQYSPYLDCYTYKYIPDNLNYIYLGPGDVTFSSSNDDPVIVWNSMPLDSLCVGQSFEAVSTLMIDMGRITNSRYFRYATSTYDYELANSFMSDLHLTVLSGDVDFVTLSELIIQDRMPAIFLIGHADSWSSWSNGHFVVADAMRETYQTNNDVLTGRYVGFNWGWDGQCDDIWLNTDVINWNIQSNNYNTIHYMVYAPVIDI